MRFIVDFKRYPTAVCVMVIQYFKGDGMVIIETTCSDAYLRWLFLHGFDVPTWWQKWRSTQAWIIGLQANERAAA